MSAARHAAASKGVVIIATSSARFLGSETFRKMSGTLGRSWSGSTFVSRAESATLHSSYYIRQADASTILAESTDYQDVKRMSIPGLRFLRFLRFFSA